MVENTIQFPVERRGVDLAFTRQDSPEGAGFQEDELLDREIGELGTRTILALGVARDVVGIDGAEEAITIHDDLNMFIERACDTNADIDIIKNHISEIGAEFQHLLDVHLRAIKSSVPDEKSR